MDIFMMGTVNPDSVRKLQQTATLYMQAPRELNTFIYIVTYTFSPKPPWIGNATCDEVQEKFLKTKYIFCHFGLQCGKE